MSATSKIPRLPTVAFVGQLIFLCLYPGFGTAEQIIETESRVVLEVGTKGILPCRIQRESYLIQWKRQLKSERLLVYLNPYFHGGLRGVPRDHEGLFNITEDYSLIIKDVKVRDEGLYICEVSDFKTGKVFRNRTRVSVQGTQASVVLEMGARVILPCRIQGGTYQVWWKRQLSSETELLVSLDPFSNDGAPDGPGYEKGLFNITEDYSLVIKDFKVKDEGLYICILLDYKTRRVFRNSTRVSVQALPREPFPTIQECVGKNVNPGACILTIDSTSNLTCSVMWYYPDIDLFFFHGFQKVTSTAYEEWDNADGTKNKNITIQVDVSDEPYQCVASGLPVIGGNRSVSVIVQASPHSHSQGPNAVAFFVPSVVTLGICLFIAAILKYRRRNSTGWRRRHDYVPVGENPLTYLKHVKAPEGPISKLELWQVIKIAELNNDFQRLRKVVRRLFNNDALPLQKDLDLYESLCTWKSEMSPSCNQREELYSVCYNVGMTDTVRTLRDVVMDASHKVSREIFEHILWEIEETSKITELLTALELNHESVTTAVKKGRREVVYMARRELVKWRKQKFHINPLVILSLKLDDLECDIDFFKVHVSEMEEIDVDEMRARTWQISGQHLVHLLNAFNGVDEHYQIELLVQENHESLFNTILMLHDWVQNEECSNYEIRNRLRKAVQASSQKNHTDDRWPPDEGLRVIARLLSQTSMKKLSSKLKIENLSQEANEGERFQALIRWRDNHAASKDLTEKHTELFSALKLIEGKGLIPRVKGGFVYEAELVVELAFQLFSHALLPFTEALGISADRLSSYRPAFHPSHMTQGTIGLVCKLFESGER